MSSLNSAIYKYTPTAVGLLLVYAGIYKLLYPASATLALESLDIPERLAASAVAVSIVLELYLGVILLLKLSLRYALILATALMLIFALFLSYLSLLARPPACGCMGLTAIFHSNRQNAFLGLLRNCAILWFLRGSHDYYFPVSKTSRVPAHDRHAGDH